MGLGLEVESHHGYNEHVGPGIVKVFHPEKFHMNKELAPELFERYRREFYGTYFKLAIPWVKGELVESKLQDIESWAAFKSRFTQALSYTLDNCASGSTVAIFTSGGPVGAAAGEVLGLSEEKTAALGWQVKNASFSEYLYSKGNISLVSFNETPHLLQSGMQTLV
jgi:broad specificity phosphatase PhoE